MPKNDIKITRVPGDSTHCTATLELAFEATDRKAVQRFARILRELIPEEEHEQFLTDLKAAGAAAGLQPFAE